MSVRATIAAGLTVRETIGTDPAGLVNSSQNAVTVDGNNVAETLTATSTPAVTAHAFGVVTLSSGTATIDLTALTGLNGVAVSLNGLKPRAVLLKNNGANPMVLAEGASNGYAGFGASLTLLAGETLLKRLGAGGTAVAAGDKTIDVTGTGAQVLEYQIVAGA